MNIEPLASPPASMLSLESMTEAEIHAHVRAVLCSPSGRVLRQWLRLHCFMDPARAPAPWRTHEQVEFRYGRMTLFQMLEHLEDPNHFTKETRQ